MYLYSRGVLAYNFRVIIFFSFCCWIFAGSIKWVAKCLFLFYSLSEFVIDPMVFSTIPETHFRNEGLSFLASGNGACWWLLPSNWSWINGAVFPSLHPMMRLTQDYKDLECPSVWDNFKEAENSVAILFLFNFSFCSIFFHLLRNWCCSQEHPLNKPLH